MEAVRTSEMSVYFETTWRCIPESCRFRSCFQCLQSVVILLSLSLYFNCLRFFVVSIMFSTFTPEPCSEPQPQYNVPGEMPPSALLYRHCNEKVVSLWNTIQSSSIWQRETCYFCVFLFTRFYVTASKRDDSLVLHLLVYQRLGKKHLHNLH
jgi:hypothetical protein